MKYERKKMLIDSRLQFRMIGVFLAVSVVASAFQLVLFNHAMLGLSDELAVEGKKVLARTSEILTAHLLWTAVLLLPLTVLVGLLITHRVAGPAYRMREYCRAIARGERPGPCTIREHDELQDLCAALNAALEAAARAVPEAEAGTESPSSLEATPAIVPSGTKREEEAEASSSCEG